MEAFALAPRVAHFAPLHQQRLHTQQQQQQRLAARCARRRATHTRRAVAPMRCAASRRADEPPPPPPPQPQPQQWTDSRLSAPGGGGDADDDAALSSGTGFSLRELHTQRFSQLSSRRDALSRRGAYAIRAHDGDVVYMGYSKNVAAKLLFHHTRVPQHCVSFQVYAPPLPPHLLTPDVLEGVLEYWVRETGGVPVGNAVDRALWEPAVEPPPPAQRKPAEEQVPLRERSSPPRSARARASAQPSSSSSSPPSSSSTFSDAFRATAAPGVDWSASEHDYVHVHVDPFDAFSASGKRAAGSRSSSAWQHDEHDEGGGANARADWVPILALMGVAGLIWLIGVLGNALPAATPSMGM